MRESRLSQSCRVFFVWRGVASFIIDLRDLEISLRNSLSWGFLSCLRRHVFICSRFSFVFVEKSANCDESHLTPRTTRRAPAYGVEARKFGHPHGFAYGDRELVRHAENGLGQESFADAHA